jgi:hypothetical protein
LSRAEPRALAWLTGISPVDLALRLTLLGLVLRPVGDPFLRGPLLVLAVAGLVVPGLLRQRALWLLVTLLTGARVVLDWQLADNHAYLLAYWCLAIWLALGARDARAELAASARWLVGLVFLLAAVWKGVLSSDYLDGRMFEVLLILDPRFEPITHAVAGVDPGQLDALRAFLRTHVDAAISLPIGPEIPARLVQTAHVLTWWTLGIETAVAAAWLLPGTGARQRFARDTLLLTFCATTYPAVGIESFGWLLLAMGVASSAPDRDGVRLAYLGGFALLVVVRALGLQ